MGGRYRQFIKLGEHHHTKKKKEEKPKGKGTGTFYCQMHVEGDKTYAKRATVPVGVGYGSK